MILQDPGVGMKDCQVWQPIEQVFLMDAAGSCQPGRWLSSRRRSCRVWSELDE